MGMDAHQVSFPSFLFSLFEFMQVSWSLGDHWISLWTCGSLLIRIEIALNNYESVYLTSRTGLILASKPLFFVSFDHRVLCQNSGWDSSQISRHRYGLVILSSTCAKFCPVRTLLANTSQRKNALSRVWSQNPRFFPTWIFIIRTEFLRLHKIKSEI